MNGSGRSGADSARPRMPTETYPGAVPTMNGRGFMLQSLDPYSQSFVTFAARCDAPVLDIGCAYGIATLAALAEGARVCACDMEASHLEILRDKVPAPDRARLTTQVGQLPDADFPMNSFGAILASRVIHFLDGDEVELAVRNMAAWLVPGGRLFLVVDTPYMPSWSASVPTYELRKRQGDKWPGFLPDFSLYASVTADPESYPDFMNPMDPDILARVCEEAGLEVVDKGYAGLQRGGPPTPGKEHAGCTAVKVN